MIAHIGNIPVEEWAPFVVPVVALYVFGRRRDRRRRAAVRRLPSADEALAEGTIRQVEAEWRKAGHEGVSREHLPLLYPPGPDDFTPAELAERVHSDPETVGRLLDELAELDYLTMDGPEDRSERVVSLTFRGFELVDTTEVALLSALGEPEARAAAGS